MSGDVLVYDVKLPDRIEPYLIRSASIRRNDDVAFVCDCVMPADVRGVALRHYSFPDRWWAANVALSLDGTLRAEFGPEATFTYDCDITTPHFEAFGALCNVDLKLDIFLHADARTYVVTDLDDFTEAVDQRWIDAVDEAGAERGLKELIDLIERDSLRGFLEAICPFGPLGGAAEPVILEHRRLDDEPVVAHWRSVRSA